MTSSRMVIKFGQVWRLVEFINFEIKHLTVLPFMSEDHVTTDGDIVVGVSGKSLIILRINDYIQKGELEVVELPDDLIVHTLRIGRKRREAIYIGGKTQVSMFDDTKKECQSMYYIDLNATSYELKPFPLPDDLKKSGKAIDDVGLYMDCVYVLDDLILPKFLYIFGIKDFDLKEVLPLEVHGTYEGYLRVVINYKYIIMLSGTIGDGGGGRHLTFYNRESLQYLSSLSLLWSSRNIDLMSDIGPMFNDILLIDNHLVIAAGKAGVVKLNLDQEDVLKDLGIIDRENNDKYHNFSDSFKKKYLSSPYVGEAQAVQYISKENDSLKAVLATVCDSDISYPEVKDVYRPEVVYFNESN